ncbi:alpha/beta fold hydrolase [Pseudomonas sp. Pseu.R1]|uniref:alpha/beta fold hydrolase n=1 Tax=Pseudomonas sp. Pseu.R1 TaxID=3379818 RepID=UPI003B947D7D
MSQTLELQVPNPEMEEVCRALAVPERVSASLREMNVLSKGWQAFLEVDEQRIAFWMFGSGPIALLMHGWCSRGSHLAGYVKPLLAAGYSVVLFDAPGHGHSSGTFSSIIHTGRVVLKLAEHLGGIHALIAHSAGSTAALWALANGLIVRRSVHICGPTSLSAVVLDIARSHGLNDRETEAFCIWAEDFMGASLHSLDLPALSMGLKHPGLLIHDVDDPVVPMAQSNALHVIWTRSTLMETSGLGHRRILSDAHVISSAVEFLGSSHYALAKRG